MTKDIEDKTWIEKISNIFLRSPQDRSQLTKLLQEAKHKKLLDDDAFNMIEGVMQVSLLKARDVMIPKTNMVCVDEQATLKTALPVIIDSGHSRFPILNEQNAKVTGILLAKDLLKLVSKGEEDRPNQIRKISRAVALIPESKRLDALLRDFKKSHNHMAIVIDEYGEVSGLITIEDVLEQIVGDIEDEFDTINTTYVSQVEENEFIVKSLMPVDDFNEYFKTDYPHGEFDTIGGFLLREFSHVPKKGETLNLGRFKVTIIQARKRRIDSFRLRRRKEK